MEESKICFFGKGLTIYHEYISYHLELDLVNLFHDLQTGLSNLKVIADIKSNIQVVQIIHFFQIKGQKTLREKKKMLVPSIFFFTHIVFKSVSPKSC